MGLTKVEDKQLENKIDVPIAKVLRGIRYLDMQEKEQDYPMEAMANLDFNQ